MLEALEITGLVLAGGFVFWYLVLPLLLLVGGLALVAGVAVYSFFFDRD